MGSEEDGGMDFRSLAKFNVALLAKQGWCFMNNPDSLVTRVYKAKYFSNSTFINSSLGSNSSFTWKSIWASKGVLMDGLCWKVGSGTEISVLNDVWAPYLHSSRLISYVNNLNDFKVAELIDQSSRKWKHEVLESTFPNFIVQKIQHIPLAKEPNDDVMAWSGEPLGEFTVRSAYKLLQHTEWDPTAYALQTVYKNFYKKLWSLNLPSKIKITTWKISWNYLPTRVNMHHRRLLNTQICPSCGRGAEDLSHLYRECLVSLEIWKQLSLLDFFQTSKMRSVHERTQRSVEEIVKFIRDYILELDATEKAIIPKKVQKEVKCWKPHLEQFVKLNFDAAFDSFLGRATVGVVARDGEGSVLLSLSLIHKKVSSAFATEALACSVAVRTGVDMRWRKIIIEGDALIVIKKCRKQMGDRSMIGAIIHDIQQLQTGFEKCSFIAYTKRIKQPSPYFGYKNFKIIERILPGR
ncbi:reverse transcriptase [Gossypium australe]|uniref:Reverse transcriptase n=1 Tax=Gossypium australe TaxID=47621 RepID=A0A5B6V7U6_9ROSI|nr:reverse transcriptase [Gossypium australe]